MLPRALVLSVLLLLPLLLAPGVAHAIKKPTCTDPYDAVDSVWRWQQKEGEIRLDYASACFDAAGRSLRQRQRLAQRLAVVYDHEPAIIDLERLREMKADHVDPATREAKVVPHERFPEVYLERRAGRWLWSKRSLDWIDRYYVENLSGLDRAVESMPSWLKGEVFEVAYWQYLALALLLACGLVLRKALRVVVAARLRRLSQRIGPSLTRSLVDVVASPGATLLVAVLLRLGYPQLRLPADAALVVQLAVRLLIIVSVLWATYRAIDLLAVHLEARAQKTEGRLDSQLVPLLRKALKVVLVVAGALIVLQMLNVNVPSLLAGLGLGGLAVALAAKETLANLFGSLAILLDGPFQIGDWVSVEGVEGTVEEVGLRSTRLRTAQDSVVVFPNAKLADARIDNFQHRRYRRCLATVALGYEAAPEQVQAFVEGARAVVQANPGTHKDAYEIHVAGFGAQGLEVQVLFFLAVQDWSEELRLRHNVYLELVRLARDLGVRLAVPARALLVERPAAPGAEPARPAVPAPEELRRVVEGYGPGGALGRPAGAPVSHGFWPVAEGAA
ncbi:MAG: mechanosensitive ion channel [Deltaproteobacteria bacterium]|nr:mechanosensitive ion channel [Deltaproteobacteria bacterium]